MSCNESPLVSFVVLTYNHAKFAVDMLEGAFSQTYPNLEIIISDDASLDGTYEIVRNYVTAHQTDKIVHLNRNEKNMGFIPHFNHILDHFVHGGIIVLAGGDDVSLPHRVEDTMSIFCRDQTIKAVSGQLIKIDESGKCETEQPIPAEEGIFTLNDDYIKSLSFMCGGAGLAFRREVWDTFGPLLNTCPTEDSTLRFRSVLLGRIATSSAIYIKYRRHAHNLSREIYKLSTKGIVAQYRKDLKCAYELGLISPTTQKRLDKKIKYYALERNCAAAKQGKTRWMRAPYKLAQLICQKIVRYA